jgi:hypothetical protein
MKISEKLSPGTLQLIKTNATIIIYLLQVLFILIYSEPDVQPFVYVHF